MLKTMHNAKELSGLLLTEAVKKQHGLGDPSIKKIEGITARLL